MFNDRQFFAGRFQGLRGEDLFTWIPEGRSAGFGVARLLQRGITELATAGTGGDGLLYHYTSAEALEAILASGELWLSDYRSLNDAAEIRYGRTIAHQTFDDLRTTPLVHEMLIATVDQDCADAFFVTSFTWSGDELSQWRAYGDSARGVALGFEPLGFATLLGLDPQGISLSRVSYARPEQERLFGFVGSIADQAWLMDTSRDLGDPEVLRRHIQRAVLERLPLCTPRGRRLCSQSNRRRGASSFLPGGASFPIDLCGH